MVGSVCAHVSDLSVLDVLSKRERGEEGIFLSEELCSIKCSAVAVIHTEWLLGSRNIKKLGNNFITWCFIATAIHLYKLTVLFCMAEKGFYSWQAACNILRIIKVSCSCRIMHIIMARGFTLMCLGGGYYFRMCIHIWMKFEFFHPDQNDIHRRGPWTIISASSLWVIKWWEEKMSSNSAGMFEKYLKEHNFFLTFCLYIYKLSFLIFKWVIWALCSS